MLMKQVARQCECEYYRLVLWGDHISVGKTWSDARDSLWATISPHL